MTTNDLDQAREWAKDVHPGHHPEAVATAKVIASLSDFPRMVWPDERPATEEDVSIIPPKIDTSTGHDDDVDMTPEDVPAGELWLVECYGDRHVGTRDPNAAPNWVLARMDGVDVIFAGDHLVTLVSRLVPEVTA